MIVTPDEKLTIKLMLHLQANNMDANIIRDHPLKISKVAVWLQLCLNFIFKRADNLSILSLLKHPYADIDETKLIEMELLMREGSFSYLQLSSFLNDNDPIKHDLWSVKSANFSSILSLHISFSQSLSKEHLWDTYEGEKLKEYLDQCNNFAICVSLKEYVEFFNYFLRSAYYRVEENVEAKITLAKPIDARLHKADLMILAGLNEGIWPRQMDIDPCFNRALLKKLQIVLPEEIIEEELHDFKNFIYAKNVILTRSEKIDGSSTVASRWLMKLLTLANDIKTIDYHRPRAESSSRNIYDLAIPPLHARPKQLSVTEIEKLIANPYQIYVDKILKLKKLPSLKNDLSQSDFGIFVHKALENYNKIRNEPDITILLSLAKKILPNNHHAQILWWPRFVRIAKWFVENQRSKYYSEIPGRYNIDENFVITARADHIEINDEKEVIIIDYKTGKLPSIKDINNGEAVQLLLAGIIAQNGKFICQNSNKQYKLVKLQYIQLNGSQKPIAILSIEESLSDLLLKTEENILNLIKSYYSQSTAYNYHKTELSNYCIYQHLSRQFYY
jgi:ATP-dependent helicase/nuclease subunit B